MDSYVYFIKPVERLGPIKIGFTKYLQERLAQLASWSPDPLEIVGTCDGGRDLERKIHHRFAHLHTHHEWFAAAPELIGFVSRVCAGEAPSAVVDLTSCSSSFEVCAEVLRTSFASRIGKAWNRPDGRLRAEVLSRADKIMSSWRGGLKPSDDDMAFLHATVPLKGQSKIRHQDDINPATPAEAA